jgi:hypothetical protein
MSPPVRVMRVHGGVHRRRQLARLTSHELLHTRASPQRPGVTPTPNRCPYPVAPIPSLPVLPAPCRWPPQHVCPASPRAVCGLHRMWPDKQPWLTLAANQGNPTMYIETFRARLVACRRVFFAWVESWNGPFGCMQAAAFL